MRMIFQVLQKQELDKNEILSAIQSLKDNLKKKIGLEGFM